MKPAIACCSILALALVTYSVAQNAEGQATPDSLLKLFKVGDHLGVGRNAEMSGYDLYFSSETDVERAKNYYLNEKVNREQYAKLNDEWRKVAPSASPEQRAKLSKKMAEFQRPSPPVERVIAIGDDFIALVSLDTGSEAYIPMHSIVSVHRKPLLAESAANK